MKALIYTRISRDVEHEALGVQRQQQDCEALCKRRGWEVVQVYSDNDISAAGNKKARPAYDSMLEAIRNGEADVIVAYSNSRLSRRPAEWLDLINLANQGTQIATVVSGQHDLTTADGRAVAMTIAIWDAAEAERTGERIKRQKQQRASEGKKQGGRYRVYGYDREYNVIESEALIVKEIFKRRAAGESATSIGADLTERGLETVAGGHWTAQSVIKLINKTEYAGNLTHAGQVVGKTSYEAIVDDVVWQQANDKTQQTKRGTNARKHALSGILVCSKCMSPMKGNSARGGKYACPSPKSIPTACGKCAIKMDDTDNEVFNAAWAKFQELPAPVSQRDYQAEVDAIDKRIKEAQDAFAAGGIAMADLMPMLASLREERAKVIAEQPTDFGVFNPLIAWEDWTVSQKKVWITSFVEYVLVYPPTQGARAGYDPRRLEIHFKDGSKRRLQKPGNIRTW